jgi:hypothetical protein
MAFKNNILLVLFVVGILPLLFFLILYIGTPTNLVYGQVKRDIRIKDLIFENQNMSGGDIFISGESNYDSSANCTVYGYYNNLKRIAVPTGIGMNNYSKWTLTYNVTIPHDQNIKVELSCPGHGSSYDSIHVGITPISPPTTATTLPSIGGGRTERYQ